MRIVAGKWKGRKLHELSGKVLASELRPTLDRVRETIFNILTHGIHYEVKGARVLDLFCGTGALGFEALSRGASCACLIDNEKLLQEDQVKSKKSMAIDIIRQFDLARASSRSFASIAGKFVPPHEFISAKNYIESLEE